MGPEECDAINAIKLGSPREEHVVGLRRDDLLGRALRTRVRHRQRRIRAQHAYHRSGLRNPLISS